jgi:hypothetical protein
MEVQKNMRHVTEGIKKMWQVIYLHSNTYAVQYLSLPFGFQTSKHKVVQNLDLR